MDASSRPAPSVLELDEMRRLEAGPVTFGLIFREFTEASLAPHEGRPGVAELLERIRTEGFSDGGVSVYVYGPGGHDHLRFDCFRAEPHYHYQHPVSDDVQLHHQRIAGRAESVVRDGRWYQVPFDTAANGDMFDWTLNCLRTRLPEMLAEAGASELAADLDPAAVHKALDELEDLARRTMAARP
jgi:hypothetical protein